MKTLSGVLSATLMVALPAFGAAARESRPAPPRLIEPLYGRGAPPFGNLGVEANPLRRPLAGPVPLDEGGGVSAETRQIMALVFGLVLGFGIGHLIARDKDGFILFLALDLGICILATVLDVALHTDLFWALGGLGLLISHVIQGLDAYASAGGPRFVQRARDKAIAISGATDRVAAVTTSRVFAFSF